MDRHVNSLIPWTMTCPAAETKGAGPKPLMRRTVTWPKNFRRSLSGAECRAANFGSAR